MPILIVAVGCTGILGCGSAGDGRDSPDAAVPAGDDDDDLVVPDGGPVSSEACVPLDCDDGIDCTEDFCWPTGCEHRPRHLDCRPGGFCDTTSGCRSPPSCDTDASCIDDGDVCTQGHRCEMGFCVWDVLDGDGDGDPPPICGGTDCDDSRAERSTLAAESCNGIDDDCDGAVDDDLDATACPVDMACMDGACACVVAGLAICADACVDTTTDAGNCGGCGRVCGSAEACVDSVCTCADDTNRCDGICVDLAIDELNCGGCGAVCPETAECVGSACACPEGTSLCGDACTPLDVPTACGSCERSCIPGGECEEAACTPTVADRGFYRSTFFNIRDAFYDSDGRFGVAGTRNGDLRFGARDRLIDRYSATRASFVLRHDPVGDSSFIWFPPFVPEATFPVGDDVVVASRFRGTVDLGDTTISALGRDDVVLVRRSEFGETVWSRVLGTFSTEIYYHSVAADSEILVLGYSPTTIDLGGGELPVVSGRTGFVARVDEADGSLLGGFRVPPTPQRIAVHSSGDIIVFGTFRSTIDFGDGVRLTTSRWTTSGYVARYRENGTAVSASIIGLTNFRDVMLDEDDNIVVRPSGVQSYSLSGLLRWTMTTSRFESGRATSFTTSFLGPSDDGGFFVGGRQAEGFDFGGGRATEPYSMAVVELESGTGDHEDDWRFTAKSRFQPGVVVHAERIGDDLGVILQHDDGITVDSEVSIPDERTGRDTLTFLELTP